MPPNPACFAPKALFVAGAEKRPDCVAVGCPNKPPELLAAGVAPNAKNR